MTPLLARPVLLALAGLSSFFVAAYLIPDILLHRLGLWTRTKTRAPGACALTFDDGPDPAFTPAVLDILREHNCRATFFVLGKKAAANPDLMDRMAREGHEIGIHGWDHRHPWLMDPVTCQALLKRALLATAPYRGASRPRFRPPWGYWSAWTFVAARDFDRVMWSLAGKDWERGATPYTVANRVSAGVCDGSIVLLHDGGRYSGTTAAALSAILKHLKSRGLRQVTVGELERLSHAGRMMAQGSAFKRAARAAQDRLEARFERRRRLMPCGIDAVIRIETLAHEGPKVTLRTGLTVEEGDPVAEVHLDSRRIAGLYRSGTPMAARVRMFSKSDDGLAWIARWLLADETGRGIVAIRSTTLLDREMKHFGFEMTPLPVWPWILIGVHMRWLSFLYSTERKAPQRGERIPLIKRLMPRQAWMSRDEFLERFGGSQAHN